MPVDSLTTASSSVSSGNVGGSTVSGGGTGSRGSRRGSSVSLLSPPELSVSKGGGSLKGLDLGFRANPVTGSASFSIPLPFSPGRGVAVPPVSLSYDSSVGNGAFGLGWSLDVPSIVRQSSRRLPLYDDVSDSDVFSLSGFEDLVPVEDVEMPVEYDGVFYRVRLYRPRVEGTYSRIERFMPEGGGAFHWRVFGSDGSVSVYGDSEESRVFDSEHPDTKVYRWLLSRQTDAFGNVVCYRWLIEGAQRYLGRVLYCNLEPYTLSAEPSDYHLELSFEYESRPDCPVDCRSGFSVPLSIRCGEARMTHRFGGSPEHVRRLVFGYRETFARQSLLVSATQIGERALDGGGTDSKSLPPLTFEYSEPVYWTSSWEDFGKECVIDAVGGLQSCQWLDLWGDGLPGILSERYDSWRYKRNLGNGSFAPSKSVSPKPRPGTAAGLLDLEGDGELWLAEYGIGGAVSGASHLNAEGCWSARKPFKTVPRLDYGSARVRFADLDGDGRSEVVVDEGGFLTIYPSEGSEGYGNPVHVGKTPSGDIPERPYLLARGKTEAVFLADMSGDGVADVVRVREGEVCYWQGLGHGRFGDKVVLVGDAFHDPAGTFHPERVQLADIDGTGSADILYRTFYNGANVLCVWLNGSGLELFRAPDIALPGGAGTKTEAVDLMGSGTVSLVWSSSLLKDRWTLPKYLDLHKSKKPYILISVRNGIGKETRLEYKPSTYYYLQDRARGDKWSARLPYPVQCLSRVETRDLVTGWTHASTYTYHHGCHDGFEREFRGFGRVEQLDSESGTDSSADQSPVLTKRWYHLGVAPDGKWLPEAFANEFWDAPSDTVSLSRLEPSLDGICLNAREWKEAHRAFKGMVLREEVYCLDGSDAERSVPVSTADYSYSLELKCRGLCEGDRFHPATVWQTTEKDVLTRWHEKDAGDPRVSRGIVLESDAYGRPTLSAAVAYGRQTQSDIGECVPAEALAEQRKTHTVITETRYAADASSSRARLWRMGMQCASKTWELTGFGGDAFGAGEFSQALSDAFSDAAEIPFEAEPSGSAAQKRLVESSETLFYDASLTLALPHGEISLHGLPYETYTLSHTRSLLSHIYGAGRIADGMLSEGGFIQRDGNWHARSGRNIYDTSGTDSNSAKNFYLPIGLENAFGQTTAIVYDAYSLLVASITDPLGNTTAAENDYRTLAPWSITDPNGNRTEIETDALGIVVKTAVMGRNADEGDTLAEPTARMQYGFAEFNADGSVAKPAWIKTQSRETHKDANTRWLEKMEYSDGMGNVVLAKTKAEPGRDGSPRWVGTGRVVLNNKGNPVKQYEPYFSGNENWENEPDIVETGVTPILHYDALSRLIRTDFPDGSHSKTEFTAWSQTDFDRNDTQEGNPHFSTPTITHLDSLGRAFYVVQDCGLDEDGNRMLYATQTVLDIEGNEKKIIDARGNAVMEYRYGIHGERGYAKSMDAGERRMFIAADGQTIYTWDARGNRIHTEYDVLRRPTKQWLSEDGADEKLVAMTVYGESAANPADNNLIGKPWKSYDQSGMTENVSFDFKGNLLESKKQFTEEYIGTIDWNISDPNTLLQTETFTSETQYDALNRATVIHTPHNDTVPESQILPAYDDGGLLKTVKAKLRGSANETEFVSGISYNPKGQRERIQYGNGAKTKYEYEPETFRLTRLLTKRAGSEDALQDLNYKYDPVGNITKITDNAQQNVFFDGTVVSPSQTFEYDALYRLTKATGREHSALNTNIGSAAGGSQYPLGFIQHPMPVSANDATALQNYARMWEYDEVGNIEKLIHQANQNSFTRSYDYVDGCNRLDCTTVSGTTVNYSYNQNGSMESMPHLQSMGWNFAEQLSHIAKGTENAYYCYDGTGQRVRKVVMKNGKREERIYLGGFEIFRKYAGDALETERETLHIMDDAKRVAIVDTLTVSDGQTLSNQTSVLRFQLGNNIESATLELDETASIISYEEYYPYGETSYQAGRSVAEVSQKRYRYTGKEKDEESGLYYHGARYYACWIGRWTAADPIGVGDGVNLYAYCRGNPVKLVDPSGTFSLETGEIEAGDTLTEITGQINKALGTDFSVEDIAKANGIENPDYIRAGDKINPGFSYYELETALRDEAIDKLSKIESKNMDEVAKQGLEAIYSISKKIGVEYSLAIIKNKDGSFKLSDDLREGDKDIVYLDKISEDIAGYVHTHVTNGSKDFSDLDVAGAFINKVPIYMMHVKHKGTIKKVENNPNININNGDKKEISKRITEHGEKINKNTVTKKDRLDLIKFLKKYQTHETFK